MEVKIMVGTAKLKLTDDYVQLIYEYIDTLVRPKVMGEIADRINTISRTYLDIMKNLGCSIIGNYPVDSNGVVQNAYIYIQSVVSQTVLKYVPIFEQISANKNDFIVSKQITKTIENESRGTTRSANEESPLNSTVFVDAPNDSSNWDISNPYSKHGSQYDSKGKTTDTITDPDIAMRVADYGMINNLYSVVTNMIDNFIDEKMSVH